MVETPIEALDLSIHTYNCLKHSGIHSIVQLLALKKAELLGIRTLEPEGYEEIRRQLIRRGFMDPRRPKGPFADESA